MTPLALGSDADVIAIRNEARERARWQRIYSEAALCDPDKVDEHRMAAEEYETVAKIADLVLDARFDRLREEARAFLTSEKLEKLAQVAEITINGESDALPEPWRTLRDPRPSFVTKEADEDQQD